MSIKMCTMTTTTTNNNPTIINSNEMNEKIVKYYNNYNEKRTQSADFTKLVLQ